MIFVLSGLTRPHMGMYRDGGEPRTKFLSSRSPTEIYARTVKVCSLTQEFLIVSVKCTETDSEGGENRVYLQTVNVIRGELVLWRGGNFLSLLEKSGRKKRVGASTVIGRDR